MKSLFVALFVVFLGISFTAVSYAQDKTSKDQKKEVTKDAANAEVTVVKEGTPVNKICPVSTEEIDDPVKVSYKGKVYQLCCNSCLKKFKKDPEKYISRLSEDGKSIKKKDS